MRRAVHNQSINPSTVVVTCTSERALDVGVGMRSVQAARAREYEFTSNVAPTARARSYEFTIIVAPACTSQSRLNDNKSCVVYPAFPPLWTP